MTRGTIETVHHLHFEMTSTDAAIKVLPGRDANGRVDLFPLRGVVTTEEIEGGGRLLEIQNCQNRRSPRGTEKIEEGVIRHPDLALTPALDRDPDLGTDCQGRRECETRIRGNLKIEQLVNGDIQATLIKPETRIVISSGLHQRASKNL